MSSSRGLPLLVIALAFACADADDETASSRVIVRDSAGITIVENDSATSELPEWSVPDSGSVSIGVVEGSDEYVLQDVADAVILGDGRLLIADEGPKLIRFYDSSGDFLYARGGQGEGPGEFENISSVYLDAADSIFVWDFALERFSVLSPDGEFVRTMRLMSPPTAPIGVHPIAMTATGRLLARPRTFVGPRDERRGVWRDPLTLYLFDTQAQYLDSIGPFLGDESFGHETVPLFPRAFGRRTVVVGGEDAFYIADTDRWEIQVYEADPAGLDRPRRIIRLEHRNAPVTPADAEEYRRSMSTPPGGPLDRLAADMPMPERMPAFSEIIVDDADNLWVRAPSSGVGPRTWTVLDQDGRLIATASTPEDLYVTHIGTDLLVGVQTDDLDVEYVRVFPISKPGP